MFLLNSRTHLVIATCTLVEHRHPLYQRYGAILPSSLNRVTLRRLGLLSQGHPSRIWVRSHKVLRGSLFMGTRARQNFAAIPGFGLLLAITALQRPIPVKSTDEWTPPTSMRRKPRFRCRRCTCVAQECEPVSLSSPPCYGGP